MHSLFTRLLCIALCIAASQDTLAQQRGGPRDRVRPRDTAFREAFPIGATLPDSLEVFDIEKRRVSMNSLFETDYTVLVGGCLTCPAFRSSYPEIEAVAHDYRERGVQFYFVYQSLAHPENWEFVQPTSIQERFAQVEHAKELLKTKIPWLTDTMTNDVKSHFEMTPNSQFVFDREGKVVHRDSWGRGSSLRTSLEDLVGKVETTTSIRDLNLPRFARQTTKRDADLLPTIKVEGVAVPLLVESAGEDQMLSTLLARNFNGETRYVKLRAEADQSLMQSGSGQLYLGFRLDPIFGAAWNNLADPPRCQISTAEGVSVTPRTAMSPTLDVESDYAAREFLVEVEDWSPDQPMTVAIQYVGCHKEQSWCKPLKQEFTVWFLRDSEAGMVNGRSHFPGGRGGSRQRR